MNTFYTNAKDMPPQAVAGKPEKEIQKELHHNALALIQHERQAQEERRRQQFQESLTSTNVTKKTEQQLLNEYLQFLVEGASNQQEGKAAINRAVFKLKNVATRKPTK